MKSSVLASLNRNMSVLTPPVSPPYRALTSRKPRLRNGNDLETSNAVLVQDIINHFKVRPDVLLAHGLEHLNRNDPIKSMPPILWNTPEIHQMNPNLSLQSGLSYPLLRQRLLLRTKRQRVHRAPRRTNGFDRKASPAGTDLKDAVAARDLGFTDDVVQFGVLRAFELVARGPGMFGLRRGRDEVAV